MKTGKQSRRSSGAIIAPSQERSRTKRRQILANALLEFAEHGFDGASLRSIASRTGVPHATLTYYYGSKDQIWREAVTFMFARLEEEIRIQRDKAPSDDPLEAFRQAVESYIRYSARHPEHARITLSETMLGGGERLRWLFDTFVKSSHRSTLMLIDRLVREGRVRKLAPQQFIYIFVGMVQMPYLLAEEAALAFGTNPFDEAEIAAHVETVLQLLIL